MQSAVLRPYAGGMAAAVAGPKAPRPLRIQPNRRQVDNRFPVLGFAVTTGGLVGTHVARRADRPDHAALVRCGRARFGRNGVKTLAANARK